MTNSLLNTIDLNVAQDINDTSSGGNFENYLTKEGAAGPCLLRFVGYVEIGTHEKKTKFGDKQSPQAQLTFDVVTPRHVEEYEHDGEKKKNVRQLKVTLNIGQSTKGMYVKFFNAMNYKQKHKHFAEMLGEGFLATLTVTEDDKKQKWPNIHNPAEGIVTITAPVQTDAMAGTSKPIPVPEAVSPQMLFLWDQPNQACWDSIFIDGTYEKDGEQVSKNFIQEKVLSAINFVGSPLDAMLNGVNELPTTGVESSSDIEDLLGDL